MILMGMEPEEFEEAVFTAPATELHEIGLAMVVVTLPAHLVGGHPGECYIAARKMLVAALAFKPGHEYLKIEAGKIAEHEVVFIVEGLTTCACHGGKAVTERGGYLL